MNANALTLMDIYEDLEVSSASMSSATVHLFKPVSGQRYYKGIVGPSSARRRVLHLVEAVAAGDSTVLLGETGAHGAADSETQRLINPSRRPFFASVRAPVSLCQVLASERKALALRYEEWHALGANLLLKRNFKPLLDSLGIRVPNGNGFHAFQHANATMMDRLGTLLKVRQERLGHCDPHITQAIYTHVASEDSRRVAAQLARGSLGNFGREGTQKGKRLRSGAS